MSMLPPSTGRQEAEAVARNVPDERYDRVVRLAQAIFGAPIAALNLIGNGSQFTVASVGFPKGEIPVEDSVCGVTVQSDEILEVRDLREDERFASIPAVTGAPRARFYAGVPVRGQSGQNIGALCILDLTPRTLGRQQREMLADLGALLERELAVQEEMDLAGQVQQLMLPTSAPDIAGVEVAGRVQPAREAGGDYFDWFVVDDPNGGGKRLQVVLGDVMGKGLAASLIASEVRAVLRGHSRYTDVGDAITRTSMTTRHDLEANDRFSTLWVGRLDPSTGALDYVDAGHGLAIIASAQGYRRLYQEYLPLGMPVEDTWTKATDVLQAGELLVVVSDGVFDVLDDSFDEVEARLDAILEPGLSCRQIVDRIVNFAVTHDATDDVTAVAVRLTA
ncbi:PP2C family protein-serine/threonine phosphatase [Gryllotalpicola reticulitermitis]|uniref:PP2C family protein-serine/threonine phosphatase n=1 Tax=Gryllotalpicola reticulitermitis TaxID=1184153 RepID=A0ABV8Q0R9_9MICO